MSKIETMSLIQLCSIKLHEIENKHITEWEGWLPWNLVLLIKWSVEYGGKQYPTREATKTVVTKLINLMNDLPSENVFLKDNGIGGLQKFVRTTAFQQFWYQTRLNSWELSRQYLLFCEIPPEHPIQKNFADNHGLDTRKFLELCLLLWTWIGKNQNNIVFKPSVLSSVTNFTTDEILTFLNSISLTLDGLKIYLNERRQRIENPYFQLTEVTPLTRFPLLRDDQGNYLVYSRRVFERTITSIFYDTTKNTGGSPLAEQFASLFEKYIDQNISSLSSTYYSEAELYKEFVKEKVTDFLLPFDDCTVMLEAKAIEMRPTVQVYPGNKQLGRELRDSVVKAAYQGFSLANEITKKYDDLAIPCRDSFFLVVVTYRDLFLGNGQDMWEEFLGDLVVPFLEENHIDQKLIPPEHIVVLTIDDLDSLLSVVWTGLDSIPNILKEMVKNNSERSTMKYSFSMHLDQYRQDNLKLPTHEKVFDKMFDGLIAKIKQ
ncbi:MAG: hypothetical protein PF484_14250 [Bacteroidales bacterium]|nr:hypothetical protein [Bacteroidales bacterium]